MIFFFFLPRFPLHAWCHPGRELWAEKIILHSLLEKKKKGKHMVSKLLNPVCLLGFLRPMLTAKMWEFWPGHAKSRTKAHAVSFLCQLIVLLYTNMLEMGSQEGCESYMQVLYDLWVIPCRFLAYCQMDQSPFFQCSRTAQIFACMLYTSLQNFYHHAITNFQ